MPILSLVMSFSKVVHVFELEHRIQDGFEFRFLYQHSHPRSEYPDLLRATIDRFDL
jgi:hypothetical protein